MRCDSARLLESGQRTCRGQIALLSVARQPFNGWMVEGSPGHGVGQSSGEWSPSEQRSGCGRVPWELEFADMGRTGAARQGEGGCQSGNLAPPGSLPFLPQPPPLTECLALEARMGFAKNLGKLALLLGILHSLTATGSLDNWPRPSTSYILPLCRRVGLQPRRLSVLMDVCTKLMLESPRCDASSSPSEPRRACAFVHHEMK